MMTVSSALERIIQPSEGDLPNGLATYLLTLHFSSADQLRYAELSAKAQDGMLSAEERADLEDMLTANDVLTILHSKARSSLSSPPQKHEGE